MRYATAVGPEFWPIVLNGQNSRLWSEFWHFWGSESKVPIFLQYTNFSLKRPSFTPKLPIFLQKVPMLPLKLSVFLSTISYFGLGDQFFLKNRFFLITFSKNPIFLRPVLFFCVKSNFGSQIRFISLETIIFFNQKFPFS